MRVILNPNTDHSESRVTSGIQGVGQVTLSENDLIWCAECTKKELRDNPFSPSKYHKINELHHYTRNGGVSNYLLCPITGAAVTKENIGETL